MIRKSFIYLTLWLVFRKSTVDSVPPCPSTERPIFAATIYIVIGYILALKMRGLCQLWHVRALFCASVGPRRAHSSFLRRPEVRFK